MKNYFSLWNNSAAGATAVSTEPPEVIVQPSIQGVAAVGQTLSANTGKWGGATPRSFLFSWLLDEVLYLEDSPSFVVANEHLGKELTLEVYCVNSYGFTVETATLTLPL